MGRHKALLLLGDRPLAAQVAEQVLRVCGNVSLVGNQAQVTSLGFPVLRDVFPNQGPLGGIHAALAHSDAPWNLVVGCDMPYLTAEFLELLLRIAAQSSDDAVVPASGEGYEPLCAVYARACLAPMERALREGRRKITDVFAQLRIRAVERYEWEPYNRMGKLFSNLNTPEDYEQAQVRFSSDV